MFHLFVLWADTPAGNADKPIHRPPIRPNPNAASSNFALEPNPFEQSFWQRSYRSASDASDQGERPETPPRGGDETATKHNALPPLSSLTSPAAADPSQFPWLANQSLRTGPLSPAMLAGPQHSHSHAQSSLRNGTNGESAAPAENGLGDTTFRTGFTPGAGSGFTPGYSSLMNGTSFSNFPMPSPNTTAFLDSITNGTPMAEGDNQQAGAAHDTTHPPSAIPAHMQEHGLSHFSNHMPQQTITPNTLSALTGAYNEAMRNAPAAAMAPGQQQYYQQPMNGPVDYVQQSANAASQAANGLFLLSQAHQELAKRDDHDRTGKKIPVPPAPGPPIVNGVNGLQGQKRKSDVSAPGSNKKKAKKDSIDMSKQMTMSPPSPDMDFSDSDDDKKPSLLGRPETEEDKRRNFLERNRQGESFRSHQVERYLTLQPH